MKYSIEHLSSAIAESITFEDGLKHIIDGEVEFDGLTASYKGVAFGHENYFGYVDMHEIELKECSLLFDNGECTEFDNEELNELERNVKIYK